MRYEMTASGSIVSRSRLTILLPDCLTGSSADSQAAAGSPALAADGASDRAGKAAAWVIT